ncbi:DUF2272 domain-containing protein [Pseudoxanthomonas sp. SGD-10]|nr:DUF2272 domain-containing protein [Pseudoxanthomonas sp. SGD-10]
MRPNLPCLILLALAGLLLAPAPARAAVEACDLPPRYGVERTAAAVARVACQEYRLWYRPFIESEGRVIALALGEGDRTRLADDATPAWQQVARYWRESGTLAQMGALPGATSCFLPPGDRHYDSDCRAFLLDHPWSAAFISWVVRRAGVPNFAASPRHMDYIAQAYRDPEHSPYRYADPFADKPAPGDLLCFLRGNDEGRGAAGLRAGLSGSGPLPRQSHCEVVVAANPGGDRTLYSIGGNVLNSVVMRQLPLDRTGRLERSVADLVGAGQTAGADYDGTMPAAACGPARPEACSLNRRDWAVLLKLRTQAELDALWSGAPPVPATPAPAPAAGPEPVAAPASGSTPPDATADGD